MIPNDEQIKILWDKYTLSEKKRVHSQYIANLARFIAEKLAKEGISIDQQLLHAGCLLHDIDKNVERLAGERHPETGVRLLKAEGMEEVGELIKNHSVQNIEFPEKAPKTWEEKLLFLCDKMVKQEIIGVDQRFNLWLAEDDLPQNQKEMLRRVYPLVKSLEGEIFSLIQLEPAHVANLVKRI